jgi:hypothetical protein
MGGLKTLSAGNRLTKGVIKRVMSRSRQSSRGKEALAATLLDVDENIGAQAMEVVKTLESVARLGRRKGRIVQNAVDVAVREAEVLLQKQMVLFKKRNAQPPESLTQYGKKPNKSPVEFERVDERSATGAVLDRPLGGPSSSSATGAPKQLAGKELEEALLKQLDDYKTALKELKVPNLELHYQVRLKRIQTLLAAQKKAEDVRKLLHDAFAAARPKETLKEIVKSFHDEHAKLLPKLAQRLAARDASRKAVDAAQAAVDKLTAKGLKPSSRELQAAQTALKSEEALLKKVEASFQKLAKPLSSKLRGRFKSVYQAGLKKALDDLGRGGALHDVAFNVDATSKQLLKPNQVGLAIDSPDLPDLILTKRQSRWVSISLRMYEVEVKVGPASQEFSKLSSSEPQDFLQRTGRFVDVGLDFDHALTSFDTAFKDWIKKGDPQKLLPILDPAGFALSTRLSNQGVFNKLRDTGFAKATEISVTEIRLASGKGKDLNSRLGMDFSRKEAERQEVIDRLANSLRSAGAQVDDFELKRLVSLLPEEVWKAP